MAWEIPQPSEDLLMWNEKVVEQKDYSDRLADGDIRPSQAVDELANNAKRRASKLYKWFTSFLDRAAVSIWGAWNKGKEVKKDIEDGIQKAGTFVKTEVIEAKDSIVATWEMITDGIEQTAETVTDKVTEGAYVAWQKIKEGANYAGHRASEIKSDVVDSVTDIDDMVIAGWKGEPIDSDNFYNGRLSETDTMSLDPIENGAKLVYIHASVMGEAKREVDAALSTLEDIGDGAQAIGASVVDDIKRYLTRKLSVGYDAYVQSADEKKEDAASTPRIASAQ